MTETRGSYTPAPGDGGQHGESNTDQNGFTPAQKADLLARLAHRMTEAPNTMAALLVDYRRMEGISEETLLQQLEITPEQFTRLQLCLIPRDDSFASDIRRIAEISGAKTHQLAQIVREVTLLMTLPKRGIRTSESTANKGSLGLFPAEGRQLRAMAARDRLNEEHQEYAAPAAPTDAPAPADQPDENTPFTPEPPVDPPSVDQSHDE